MSKLVKAKGNMYDWVTHMWNPIIGCPHQCSYCYVKKFREQPEQLKLFYPFPNLGHGKKIFVGHLTDIFAIGVMSHWIDDILFHCAGYENEYILQTKNPARTLSYIETMHKQTIIGTTIETDNRILLNTISNAPRPSFRALALRRLKDYGIKTFLTIEPIMDFTVDGMMELIKIANPDFINIGADSKGHGLAEPPPGKIIRLIGFIQILGIEIRRKDNLDRIILKHQWSQ